MTPIPSASLNRAGIEDGGSKNGTPCSIGAIASTTMARRSQDQEAEETDSLGERRTLTMDPEILRFRGTRLESKTSREERKGNRWTHVRTRRRKRAEEEEEVEAEAEEVEEEE
ncbi:uncharacterized protein LOC143216995 isoform X2 [Lasioglossum baleicum]|uniref:uncharacterized protein LOC143216995 isoform X2 n=1 Tax=Lasioglossum baleicum TaxID=434251 RepID=UPI003FCE9B73